MTGLFRDPRAWGLLILAILGQTANPGTVLALPGMQQLFGWGAAAKLALAALLSMALCAPLAGIAADRMGRWPVLITGLVLYAAAGTIGPYLDSYTMVMASRIVLALGGAMVMTAQGALIGDYFTEPDRGRLIGIQIAVLMLAETALLWVAFKLSAIDPRPPFMLAALPVLLLPLLWRLLPVWPMASRDAVRVAAGWPGKVALLVGAAVLSGLIASMMIVNMPPLLSILLDADEAFIQTFQRLLILPLLVLAIASGWIRPKLGRRWTLTAGHVLVAFGMAFGVYGLGIEMLAPVLICAGLAGAGLGLCLPAYLTDVLDLTPARFRAFMVGCVVGAASLGAVLAPIIMGYYLNRYGPVELFRLVTSLSAIFAILVFLGLRPRPVDKVTHPD